MYFQKLLNKNFNSNVFEEKLNILKNYFLFFKAIANRNEQVAENAYNSEREDKKNIR